MIEKYIQDSRLCKSKIADDVSKGTLQKEDIASLLNEIDEAVEAGKIENPYIKNSYSPKIEKRWNRTYLDYLVAVAASSECFNKDFLLYLANVSSYVRGGFKRGLLCFLCALLCLLVSFGAGAAITFSRFNDSRAKNQKSVLELKEKLSVYADYEEIKAERNILQEENDKLKAKLDQIKNISSEKTEE